MKKVVKFIIPSLLGVMMLAVSCKTLNYVTVCAEPGILIELSRFGQYKVNNEVKPKKYADSICLEIAFRQSQKYRIQ